MGVEYIVNLVVHDDDELLRMPQFEGLEQLSLSSVEIVNITYACILPNVHATCSYNAKKAGHIVC